MKDFLQNIFKSSSTGNKLQFNKKLSAILICFSIAIVFWFLIVLSKDYNAVVSFPVSYNNLPGQRVVVNDLPSSIRLNIKASGFRILSFYFSNKNMPVQIDVDSRIGKLYNRAPDALVIPTQTFTPDFNQQLGADVSIISCVPDSIVFNFSYKSVKRVPVRADLNISFEKQYDSVGTPFLVPDSVNVSGPESVISKINYILTEPVVEKGVRETLSKKVKLINNKMISLNDTAVKIKIPVEKFTEENVEIAVIPVHVQKGFVLKTFPEKVNIRFQVSLSKYSQVSPSLFAAVVDAGKLNDSRGKKMNVELISAPSYIKSIRVEPEWVDYILRKQ
jgi:YbbR domain-containing protein